MTPAPKHRWFRYSLRTLFVVVTAAAVVLGWLAYNLHWISERQIVLTSRNYNAAEGSFFLEPPPVAPWSVRLFGARSYRWVVLVIVDPERAQSDDEMHTDLDDERLTESERNEILRLGRLFPEAHTHAWFRATPP